MAKIDPYLRPLFDALHDMIDPEKVSQHLERGVIEVAPLAFMRGRTLNDSFMILDEAQNTTPEQMKMFLTRLGFGSKMVVTGDVTQVDLPREQAVGADRRRRTSSEGSRASSSSASATRTSCATGSCSASSRPTRSTPARRAGDPSAGRRACSHGVMLEHRDRRTSRGADGPAGRDRARSSARSRSPQRGLADGHLAIEFVDEERIRELNREHRGIDEPTDVLSFPIDGDGAAPARASSATS